MDAPRRIEEIDWSTWRPVDRATLVFVVRDGEILLIRKLRGLGRGKINGPGGRLGPASRPSNVPCGRSARSWRSTFEA
ncbi:MAG: hypothetical protein R2991_11440 [Thermoanaerobaculia bacterium]